MDSAAQGLIELQLLASKQWKNSTVRILASFTFPELWIEYRFILNAVCSAKFGTREKKEKKSKQQVYCRPSQRHGDKSGT